MLRERLKADCARCFALCCVAPAFSASADFAIDKPAGTPCPNLRTDFRCGIHDRLRDKGFPGCTVFDCFGAGQQVAQVTYAGHHWRQKPATTADEMFAVFIVMRSLHELLWYLDEANELAPTTALDTMIGHIETLTNGTPTEILALDIPQLRADANVLLRRASDTVRGEHHRDLRGADLIGHDLRGADLRNASLRGAYLIGADLSGADLRRADVIGADFRGANLSAADLTGALYLTQAQLDAARGDSTTRTTLTRPAHW